MKPTQEQIKAFWEWVFGKDGLEYGHLVDGEPCVLYRRTRWIEADEEWDIEPMPEPDDPLFIYWLFKYAVPVYKFHYGGEALYKLLVDWACKVSLSREEVNPALALFWALNSVKETSK